VLHFAHDIPETWCSDWLHESTLNKKAPHSSFSSDMEIYSFDPSEKVKTGLIGMKFEKNELLARVSTVVVTILPGKFRRLLRNVC
jgi:hypothetical protein